MDYAAEGATILLTSKQAMTIVISSPQTHILTQRHILTLLLIRFFVSLSTLYKLHFDNFY